MDCNAIIIIMG